MKVAVMQPYAFPYIGYFQLINAVDRFILLDDVNYITRGWVNRNRILVNGKEHLFTVPLKKASQNSQILECELSDTAWRDKLLKTIEYSYRKAPQFNDAFGLISDSINCKESNLSKWIFNQLGRICEYLDIETTIIESSQVYSNSDLKGKYKIMDICRKEKATVYFNAIGGMTLYNRVEFMQNGINLKFLKSIPQEYPQFKNDFIPFLSIIDHLMFNSKNRIKNQLNNFELI